MGDIIMNDLHKRVSRLESLIAGQVLTTESAKRAVYEAAVADHNEEAATLAARNLRNYLLDESDKEVTLDRIPMRERTPEGLVAAVVDVLDGPWASYRQALRDLPTQDGFPFDIQFPTAPEVSNL